MNLKDRGNTTPIDYFQQAPQTSNISFSCANEKNNLIDLASRGEIESLALAINSLGIDARETCIKALGSYQRSILHAAAGSGSTECLKLIIETVGKDVNLLYFKDSLGRTPAHYAATYGSLECLKTILQLSPFPLEKELLDDDETSSILDRAIGSNNISISIVINLNPAMF